MVLIYSQTTLTMSPSPAQPWSWDQLNAAGAPHGCTYTPLDGGAPPGGAVLSGLVDQLAVDPMTTLAMSQVQCLQGYRSCSSARQLSIVLLLQGQVRFSSHGGDAIQLSAGQWVTAGSDAAHPLACDHASGQELVALSLAVDSSQEGASHISAALAHHWQDGRPRVHHGTAPHWLRHAALEALRQQRDGDRSLAPMQAQGAGLMLLSHGLAAANTAALQAVAPPAGATPRERRLLERACQLLRDDPARDHRLSELAAAACMSQSVFVTRFRQLHGCTPFAWLQHLRMERASALLEQGHSVQEAALAAGYRHSTNFATAFRRLHGVAPSGYARG